MLSLRNRQRTRVVDLRRCGGSRSRCCKICWPVQQFDLGIYLVGAAEITRLNEKFLRHQGSTDVITFNYAEAPGPGLGRSGLRAAPGRSTGGRARHSVRAANYTEPAHSEGSSAFTARTE